MSTTTEGQALQHPTPEGQALYDLAGAVQVHRDARTALDVATAQRDAAIRAAVKAGHAAADVARYAGVNRARVYQVLGATSD